MMAIGHTVSFQLTTVDVVQLHKGVSMRLSTTPSGDAFRRTLRFRTNGFASSICGDLATGGSDILVHEAQGLSFIHVFRMSQSSRLHCISLRVLLWFMKHVHICCGQAPLDRRVSWRSYAGHRSQGLGGGSLLDIPRSIWHSFQRFRGHQGYPVVAADA